MYNGSKNDLGKWLFEPCASTIFPTLVIFALLLPAQARALDITVNGIEYTISTLNGSYNGNAETLQKQLWWGDASLARDFADQYNASITTSIDGATLNLFSHRYEISNNNIYSVIYRKTDNLVFNSNQNAAYSSPSQTFAIASAKPVPEIDAGSFSQAVLIIFGLWLVVTRRPRSQPA